MTIPYQFSAMPAEWILDQDLSATDKLILCALILKTKDEFSTLGYEELGKIAGICKRHCIRLCDILAKRGFIEIYTHYRPAKIRVCLERLGGDVQEASKGDSDVTFRQSKGDSDVTFTQNKRCYESHKKVTCMSQKGDMYVTSNRFKLDFSRNTRAGAREEKATADAAAVLSMPNAGQAGENTQQGNSARFGLDDLNDCQSCIENIDGAKEFSFFYGNGQLTFRPAWKLAKYNETSINAVIKFFKEKCGKEIRFLDNAHCLHEQKIV